MPRPPLLMIDRMLPPLNLSARRLVYLHALLLSMLLALAPALLAKQGDLSQPVEVSADASEYDERKGTQSLRGNVEISQGTLRIQADQIDVFLKANQLNRIVGTGKPVRFEQENDAGEMVRGTARSIEYDATTGILVLSGGATLQQPRQKLDSQRIVFDARQQKVSAEGDAEGGRVNIRIQPPADAAERLDESTGRTPEGATEKAAEPAGQR